QRQRRKCERPPHARKLTSAHSGCNPKNERKMPVNQLDAASMANVGRKKEKRRRPKAPPPLPPQLERLVERIRNVVERRIQLVADALHRADGGDGNQSGDQAVFDGGRALVVLNQLQKLDHLRSPTWLMTMKTPHPAHCTARRSSRNLGDTG